MSARVIRFPKREEPETSDTDWRKAMLYAALFGMCVGFWIGVIFAIAAVTS